MRAPDTPGTALVASRAMSKNKLSGLKDLLGSLPSQGFLELGAAAVGHGELDPKGDLSEKDRKGAEVISALFECVFLVAAADGKIADEEAEELVEVLTDLTDGKMKEADIDAVADACAKKLEREGFAEAIASAAGRLDDDELRRIAFVMATGVAFVDGTVDPREEALFGALADALKLPRDEALDLLNRVASAVDEYETENPRG